MKIWLGRFNHTDAVLVSLTLVQVCGEKQEKSESAPLPALWCKARLIMLKGLVAEVGNAR